MDNLSLQGTVRSAIENIGSGSHMAASGDTVDKNGILHCGICGGAKERWIDFPDIGGEENSTRRTKVRCLCRCEVEANGEKERQEEYRQEMLRISRLKDRSLIEDRLRDVNFDTFVRTTENEKLYGVVRKYVANFDEMCKSSQGIIFYGKVGVGKSYAAACIANELLNRKVPVVMTSFVKILQALTPGEYTESEDQLIGRLNSAKLLIIDDLGSERNTDFALEKIYNVIDSRYRVKKPLILTTNMDFKDMQATTDIRYQRIYDRIFEMCYPFRVQGKSWRMGQAAGRFEQMKALLEG